MTAAAGAGSPTPQEAAAAAVAGIWNAVDGGARTTIVDSPPGAGKSTLVRHISGRLVAKLQQVPIVGQTNNRADDMVAAFLRDNNARAVRGEPPLRVARLHRATG